MVKKIEFHTEGFDGADLETLTKDLQKVARKHAAILQPKPLLPDTANENEVTDSQDCVIHHPRFD